MGGSPPTQLRMVADQNDGVARYASRFPMLYGLSLVVGRGGRPDALNATPAYVRFVCATRPKRADHRGRNRIEELPDEPSPWLLATTRGVAATMRRTQRRRTALNARLQGQQHPTEDLSTDSGEDPPAGLVHQAFRRQEIRHSLPHRVRGVLVEAAMWSVQSSTSRAR